MKINLGFFELHINTVRKGLDVSTNFFIGIVDPIIMCDGVVCDHVTKLKLGKKGSLTHAKSDANGNMVITHDKIIEHNKYGQCHILIKDSVELPATDKSINGLLSDYAIANEDNKTLFKCKNITAIKCGKDGYVFHDGKVTYFNCSVMVG